MDVVSRATELVKQLIHPRFASSANVISQQLLDIQLSTEGWAVADSLLNSDDPNLQFYGALSFQVKLNRVSGGVSSLNEQDAVAVLDRLLAAFYACVHNGGPNRVLDKICSALATYLVQAPTLWDHAIDRAAMCLLSGQHTVSIDQPDGHRFDLEMLNRLNHHQVQALLRLCRFFAEDLGRFEGRTLRHHQVEQSFKTCVPTFVALVCLSLARDRIVSRDLSEEALAAYSAWSLYAASHWQHELETWRTLQGTTNLVMELLGNRDLELATTAASALTEVLSSNSRFFDQEQLSRMWPLLSQARNTSSGESHDDRQPLLRLMATWSTTMIPQIQKRPDIPIFRDALTQLTQIIFEVDWVQDGCDQLEITTEFWIKFCDHLVDYEVDLDEGRRHRFESILDPVIEAYFDALDPKYDDPKTVDLDHFDAWKRLRADFGEIMSKLMETDFIPVYAICADQLDQALGRRDWVRIEAVLQLLNDMANDYDGLPASEQGLARIFNSELFSDLIQPQSLDRLAARLKYPLVRYIDNYSSYFQQAPAQIPPVVTLLMAIMEQNLSGESKLADLAAKCLASICSSCRQVLVAMANDLLAFCDRALNTSHLTFYQRDKIYSAMAYVVQALPNVTNKVNAIRLLIEKLHQDLQRAEQILLKDQTELAEQMMVTDFQCLASIGKALHSGQRQVIEIDASPPPTNGNPENPWTTENGSTLSIRVIDCLRFIERISSSGDAWEGVCAVLRVGLSETEPGPFVFPSSLVSRFLSSMTPATPRLEALLTTACAFVSAHSRTAQPHVPSDISALLSSVTTIILSIDSPQSDPALAQLCTDFFERLLSRYTDVLLALPSQPLEAVLSFQLRALMSDTPMLKRAVASFLAALLALGGPGPSPPSTAAGELITHLAPHVAAAVTHQIGGNAQRSELDAIAKVLRALVQTGPRARQVLDHALHGDSWPTEARATEADKRAFVQRIVMLRGGRGTAEAVKEFWAKARGI